MSVLLSVPVLFVDPSPGVADNNFHRPSQGQQAGDEVAPLSTSSCGSSSTSSSEPSTFSTVSGCGGNILFAKRNEHAELACAAGCGAVRQLLFVGSDVPGAGRLKVLMSCSALAPFLASRARK